MEDNGLYNNFQSVFRRRQSCQDRIMRLADEVHKAINNKQFTLSVMIDLEKSFDLVWHQGLLYMMKQLGLCGNVLKFVEDFMKDRSIQVRVGATMLSTRTSSKMERPRAMFESTTLHHHDQRPAGIVKRHQARTVRG